MAEKTVSIGSRTTKPRRLAVQAMAAVQGKTVSQLIDEEVIEKAVQRLLGPNPTLVSPAANSSAL